MKHCKYPELKQEIKAQDARSKEIVKQIHSTSGKEREALWNDKRWLGKTTRALHLLRTFLLERPRSYAEVNWDPNHNWDLCYTVLKVAKDVSKLEIDKKTLGGWLAVKPLTSAPEVVA